MEGLTWQRPRYRQDEAIVRAPVEEDLDALIASATSKRMATFLRCLKETYADPLPKYLLLNGETLEEMS